VGLQAIARRRRNDPSARPHNEAEAAQNDGFGVCRLRRHNPRVARIELVADGDADFELVQIDVLAAPHLDMFGLTLFRAPCTMQEGLFSGSPPADGLSRTRLNRTQRAKRP
jgi:hypothetical protein